MQNTLSCLINYFCYKIICTNLENLKYILKRHKEENKKITYNLIHRLNSGNISVCHKIQNVYNMPFMIYQNVILMYINVYVNMPLCNRTDEFLLQTMCFRF